MSSLRIAALALFAGMMAGPALAQDTGGYPPGMGVAEIEARERAETERLNNAVLERDARIVAANEAEAARFVREQAEFEAAHAAHAQAQAQYEADVAAADAARARYEADMARWRQQVGQPQ
jgi:multidrug efflux pump subunit AcrA (membrane-fusion protein)